MSFNVYPAIDVRAGRVVRLCQGDYERQTTYPADPLELAAECARHRQQMLLRVRLRRSVQLHQPVHVLHPGRELAQRRQPDLCRWTQFACHVGI